MLNGSKYSTVKGVFKVVLCESRALHVVMSSDPAREPSGLVKEHRSGALLVQMNEDVHTVSKVWLSSNQNDGGDWVGGSNLWDPFGGDIVKWDGVDEAEAEDEAEDEDVHMGIAQRAQMAKHILIDQTLRDEKHWTHLSV